MVISSRKLIIASKVRLADTFISRFKGLMGQTIEPGEGLLLLRCRSIHTFFMKMQITAVYLSEDMTVLDIETLPPWRIGKHVWKTRHVLELATVLNGLAPGDKINIIDCE